jgi:excisionase family DNA binding protein
MALTRARCTELLFFPKMVLIMENPVPQQSREEYLTVREFAASLGVHPQTVRRWLRDGKIKNFLQYGHYGHYRIPKNNLKGS